MSKGIYRGVPTEVPIYKETVTELDPLTYDTKSIYFSQADYGYGPSWKVGSGIVHGGLRMYTQNIGVNSSTGGTVLTALHDLKNVKVYCEYCTENKWDKVTTIIAGETVMNEVSGTDNTALNLIWSGDLVAGEKIDCKYAKDSSNHASGEKVYWEITCDPLTEITQEIVGYETKELARKVKKPYVEVEGLARKVKKGYIGVEGVARQFFSGSGFGSFSGDYTVSQVEHNGATYDLYTLTSSGVLTLTEDTRFWMCGGGAAGGNATYSDTSAKAGGGGGGGHLLEGELAPGAYALVIGAGSDRYYTEGGATTISVDGASDTLHQAEGGGTTSMNMGDGGNGGSGGGGSYHYSGSYTVQDHHGKGDGISTYPFGITELMPHCAGGGGGGFEGKGNHYGAGFGGTNGGNGGVSKASSGTVVAPGGEYGGGSGGSTAGASATDGSFYGAGGGGAYARIYSSGGGASGGYGAGYQGVCYLLIPA